MEEVEVKFRVANVEALREGAAACGFHRVTPSTLERNTLLDTPDRALRARGELLRLREYGKTWVLTHKRHPTEDELRGRDARHKIRVETETLVSDGDAMFAVFRTLGYLPCFVYEKYREEWSDSAGHLVIDATPLGIFAELEGAPQWIDSVAARLGVTAGEYLTDSYGVLFLKWKNESAASAQNMTFAEVEADMALLPAQH